jgi:hypothetical protein
VADLTCPSRLAFFLPLDNWVNPPLICLVNLLASWGWVVNCVPFLAFYP